MSFGFIGINVCKHGNALYINTQITHLRLQCHNPKSLIFLEKPLKILKCYNFLWVQRRHNCSPAASFENLVMTLYLLKAHVQTSSFYTNNSKIPNFELWHSCREWAINACTYKYSHKIYTYVCIRETRKKGIPAVQIKVLTVLTYAYFTLNTLHFLPRYIRWKADYLIYSL